MGGLSSYIRLRPFDTSTDAGRSRERYRRAALTAATSVVSRAVSLLALLISVPLTLHYLGTERYALWMAISSFLAVITSLDLGIGNGLVTAIAECHGRGDVDGARRSTASALVILTGLAVVAFLIFAAAYPFLSWQRIFRIGSPQALAEAGPATAIFVACVLASLPLAVAGRVRVGYQRGFATEAWALVGTLLGFGGLLAAVAMRGGLPWLVLGFSGGPVLAAALSGLSLFLRERPALRPRSGDFDRSRALRLLRTGLAFFVLQMAGAVAFSSDSLIAAQVLGPEAVTRFAVTARLFTIVSVAVGIALAPLWPAYGEAVARGDVGWVRKALVRSLRVSVAVSLGLALVAVAIGDRIIRLWVGSGIDPGLSLLLGLGLATVLMTAGSATSVFLNGVQAFRFQILTGTLMASAKVVSSIALARHLGVAGLAWGTVLAYAVLVALPMAFFVPRLLARLGRAGVPASV